MSTRPGKALGEVDCGKGTAEWANRAQDYMEMLTEWGIRGNRKGADERKPQSCSDTNQWALRFWMFYFAFE